VTNVPGPQFPLYLLGREMEEFAPVPFLAIERALAVAIMSYNGGVDIGLIGDYDALHDLDDLGDDFEDSVVELLAAARAAKPRKKKPAPAGSTSV
jgi:diacylglycerol O-acyltransferase